MNGAFMHQYNSLTTLFKVRHYRDPYGNHVYPRTVRAGMFLLKAAILISLFCFSAAITMTVLSFFVGLFS
jgi:hypothetical protein